MTVESDFDRLSRLIRGDLLLRDELAAAPDLPALFAKVLKLAEQRGFHIDERDLLEKVNANRRSWIERWLSQ
jgi:hypothetical protein